MSSNSFEPGQFDILPPAHIARLIEDVGVKKVNMSVTSILTLGILAGVFISLGAAFYTIVITGSTLGVGLTKLVGGLVFSLGLILIIIGGAELFTGNTLITLSWADNKISSVDLLKNWFLVYVGNFLGALFVVVCIYLSGIYNASPYAETARSIGEAKVALTNTELVFRGLLCNLLVCMAVWMCFAAHSASSKIMIILFPISAFVALGFEHSVANMYFLPLGLVLEAQFAVVDALRNLIFVTIGNIIGGGVLVGLVYWLVYLRHQSVT